MLDVAGRNDDALPAGQPAPPTGLEEALDPVVDPADRLDLSQLIHRPGDGEPLRVDDRSQQGGRQFEFLHGAGAHAGAVAYTWERAGGG